VLKRIQASFNYLHALIYLKNAASSICLWYLPSPKPRKKSSPGRRKSVGADLNRKTGILFCLNTFSKRTQAGFNYFHALIYLNNAASSLCPQSRTSPFSQPTQKHRREKEER
jgi:hypothetical protein